MRASLSFLFLLVPSIILLPSFKITSATLPIYGAQGSNGVVALSGTVKVSTLPTPTNSDRGISVHPSGVTIGPKDSPDPPTDSNPPTTTFGGGTGLVSEGQSFAGQGMNCCIPPDPQLATGPRDIVEMINVNGEIYSKQGVPIKFFGLCSLFKICGDQISDPNVLYDVSSGRWFSSILDITSANVSIAVSETNDPTGYFNIYNVGPANNPDQPFIGVSGDKFVVSVYLTTLYAPEYWVLNKAEMVAGFQRIDFSSFTYSVAPASMSPVQSLSWTSNEYMVQTTVDNLNQSIVYLYSVIGVPPGKVGVNYYSFVVSSFANSPPAVQPGTTKTISSPTWVRPEQAAWFEGKLWFGQNDGCIPPGDSQVRSCLRLFQIDTTSFSMLQDFDVGIDGKYLYFPALRIDTFGDLDLVYGFSSSSDYPSLGISGQVVGDPSSSLDQSIVLVRGGSADTTGRYGDYFGAALDPADPGVVWVVGEYNPAASNWTYIASMSDLPRQVAQQTLLWSRTWGGSQVDDANNLVLDDSGNAYLTGFTSSFGPGSPTHSALTLLKYDPTGTLPWQRIWSGSGNGSDVGTSVAIDHSNNIYVAGYTSSFGPGFGKALLLKFNSTGSLLWQRTWGGYGYDLANGVAVDSSSGDIYVTGGTTSFGGAYDLFLLKFDSSGTLLWQKTWGGNLNDFGNAVAVDSHSGDIYLAGDTASFGAGGYDVLLLSFDSSGNLLWQKTWGGSGNDGGAGIAVYDSSYIYVSGFTASFGAGGNDVLLLKLDTAGNLLWQKTWGGTSPDAGSGVVLDASGGIYVTGNTGSFGAGFANVLLLKFDSSGGLTWQRTWGGNSTTASFGIGVDAWGNAVITGDVGEAPPYLLGFGNNSLGTPSFALGSPSFTLSTPAGLLRAPTGTLQTPSGSQTYAGSDDQFLIKYGMLPSVTFYTSTASGSITFDSTVYTNGESENSAYGKIPISADPPLGYTFTGWSANGGVSVTSPTTNPATAIILGPGTLTANFTKIPNTPIEPNALLLATLITMLSVTLARRKHG